MAEPDDTGGGGRRTEFTGPTNQIRPASGSITDDGRSTEPGRPATSPARAVSVLDLDDETTGVQHTPAPPRRPTISAAPARFMIALQEGSPVGEYEIQAQIGEGAMGTVYSAVQPLIGRTVAIKVLKPELCANQASVDRFVQEAQAVNRIGHPNIVDVFMLGELPDGRAYFVMEWLRGEDLKNRLARGRLSVPDTCSILSGVARALDAAHGKDIIHRDLKPDNVFLQEVDSGPIQVKLLDFGIAKLIREKATMEKTQTGNMLGTPRYISPEQARGVDVTHRSDIYSLGVMAYEMLAGRPPFLGETGMDLVVKHLHEAPPKLSELVRVPRSLERCVMSMLAKDPAQRPTLATVRKVFEDPSRRFSVTDIPRVAGSRRSLAIGVMVVCAAAGGVGAWQANERGWFRSDAAVVPIKAEVPETPPLIKQEVINPQKTEPDPPKPASRGTIAVTIKGAKDATILVDGEETKGVVMVEAGMHEVSASVKGQAPVVKTVTVEADKVSEVALAVPVVQVTQRPTRPIRPVVRPKQPPPNKPPASDLLTPKGMRK